MASPSDAFVFFGATGDLAKRKLIPGMAYLDQSELAPDIQVVGTSLENLTDDEFRALAKEAIESFGTHKLTDAQWESFASTLSYVPQGNGPEALAKAVAAAEAVLEKARHDHEARADAIETERAALDQRAAAEEASWDKQRIKLQEAVRRARE